MPRFILVIVTISQLITLQIIATAQSQPSATSTATSPCVPMPTLKRGQRIPNDTDTQQSVESATPSKPPTQTNERSVQIEFYGLNSLPKSEALKQLCEKGAFTRNNPVDLELASEALTTFSHRMVTPMRKCRYLTIMRVPSGCSSMKVNAFRWQRFDLKETESFQVANC